MSHFDYDASNVPLCYDRARAIPPRDMSVWLAAIERRVPRAGVRTIIDLGCGTGRFSAPLQRHYAALTVGIDPSHQMIARAADARIPGLVFARGAAEHLPIRDGGADLIFLSMVWHHLRDTMQAGREIARVLRPGGYLCVRNSTVEALGTCLYLRFFPGARAINERTLPARGSLLDSLAPGLQRIDHTLIRQTVGRTPADYVEKIALRGLSDLAALPDPEFDAGLLRLRRHCARAPAAPVVEEIDLVVFRRAA